jgi:hypothetical protein
MERDLSQLHGYSFLGLKNNKPVLKVNYKFSSAGKKKSPASSDDEGGENKFEILEIDVIEAYRFRTRL